MKPRINKFLLAPLMALAALSLIGMPAAEAAGRAGGAAASRSGGGGGARASAPAANQRNVDRRTTEVRSTSVNNVNVNRNVNVNVEHNNGWDNDYHPVARAAAVTATVAVTAAVVGSIVNAPPAGCVPVNYGGLIYQQCGTVWYQPQGGQYIVINAPY